MTHDELNAQRITHDDAMTALREIARLCDVASSIDARLSIASNIDAQRVLHEINTHLRVYSQHVNAM